MDHRLRYPLVCFDVDGTLVDDTIFIWQTLHDHFATDPVLRKKAHDDFFAKRITYANWFHSDLELLSEAGATLPRIREVLDMLRPVTGAREALLDLHARGHVIAIVSGSLDIVVDHLFPDVPFKHVLLNRIAFAADGRIAGGTPTPYDVEGKADGLRELCRREGIEASRAAFVGDNDNDLWIARAAGLAIAFNCKSDELRAACRIEVREKDLRAVARAIVGAAQWQPLVDSSSM
ncbi:MAG: HAD family phosphatase [Proteobacteria bacterium]|jgi:phosphoserine phosphatase|nr:HAD family phosphatase [Pseudomonadota bacterium]